MRAIGMAAWAPRLACSGGRQVSASCSLPRASCAQPCSSVGCWRRRCGNRWEPAEPEAAEQSGTRSIGRAQGGIGARRGGAGRVAGTGGCVIGAADRHVAGVVRGRNGFRRRERPARTAGRSSMGWVAGWLVGGSGGIYGLVERTGLCWRIGRRSWRRCCRKGGYWIAMMRPSASCCGPARLTARVHSAPWCWAAGRPKCWRRWSGSDACPQCGAQGSVAPHVDVPTLAEREGWCRAGGRLRLFLWAWQQRVSYPCTPRLGSRCCGWMCVSWQPWREHAPT